MKKPIRICMVGAGRVGKNHSRAITGGVPSARIVALVDPMPAVRQETATEFGIEHEFDTLEMALEKVDFDAVVITTPTPTHLPLSALAAENKKHVFLEKPMALNLQECDAIIKVTEQNGVILQLGFMRRFDPEFVAAAQRIEAGEIGQPMMIKSNTHGPGLPPPWARDLRTSNGMLAEVNSHDWDTTRWLMMSNHARVYAEVANLKGAANNVDTPNFYDNVLVNVKFESGGLGMISGVCPCGYGYDARVEIIGDKGIMQIGELKGQAIVVCTDRDQGLITPIFRTWPQRFEWAYINELDHFVACIQNETTPRAVEESKDVGQSPVSLPEQNPSWKNDPCILKRSWVDEGKDKMLAAVYHGPNDLRVEDVPIPKIGSGELLIKVASASICGTDLRILHGNHRMYPAGTIRIPGHEVVGTIAEVGAEVTNYRTGQRVFCAPNTGCGHCLQCVSGNNNLCANYDAIGVTSDGGFAEYVRIPANSVQQGNVIPISESVDPAVAALIEPFACVLRGQNALHITPGEVVLVMGAGPIGVMHTKLAKARGAGRVIVSEPIADRAAQARRMGADRVVDPTSENLKSVLLEESQGRGADVIIVAAPVHAAQEIALDLAAIRGRINFFGGLPKDRPTINLDSNLVHYKELVITGTTACSTKDCWQASQIVNSGLVDLSDIVSKRFPLKDALMAFAAAEDRKSLKIVLEP